MRVTALTWIWLCLTAASWVAGDVETSLRERVERTAAQLPWLTLRDVLADRDPWLGPDAKPVAGHLRELVTVARGPVEPRLMLRTPPTTGPTVVDGLRELLSHDDPKVRTLAIILLLDTNRLDVLPDIALLVADESETFPEPAPLSMPAEFVKQPWPMEKRAVGDYAKAVIERYVRASDELTRAEREHKLNYNDPMALARRLRAFAGARDPRNSTAALRVAIDRATGLTSPYQLDRADRVQEVLRRIQEVPMPWRFYVAVAIDFDRYRGEVYPPTYLLDLARHVPRSARLAAIRGERGVDDLDFPPGFGATFFLEHAADLLQPRDADLLVELGRDKGRGPAYLIAAATLRPKDAEAILTPGFGIFVQEHQTEERRAIAVALAQVDSDSAQAAAVDWFFREKPQMGAFGFGRESFLDRLQAQSPVRYRQAVARIIRDDRLTTLGPASTRQLIQAAEGYLGRRLATDEQIRDSMGIDEFQRDRRFEHLAQWQRSLKETVDEWDSAN